MYENWKPIDFMGKCSDGRWKYKISDCGSVISFAQKKEGRRLEEYPRGSVHLGSQQFLISELVAYAFIPNPYDYDYVRHLDGDKLNNHVDNLDWSPCVESEKSRVVRQYGLNGEFIASFFSVADAERKTGVKYGHIWRSCARSKDCPSNMEYFWRFADDDELAQGVIPDIPVDKRMLVAGPPVRQYELSGTFVEEYSSLRQASQQTGVDRTSIIYCCEHFRKTAGGYTWRYLDDDDIAETGIVPLPVTNKRAVRQYDVEGNIVAEYESMSKAADATGANVVNIGYCCRRKKQTCAGFVWRYIDDDEFENGSNLELFSADLKNKHRLKCIRQYVLDSDNVKFVAEYISVADASEKTGLSRAVIYNGLSRRRSGGKYIWKYVDSDPFAQYAYLGDDLLNLYMPVRAVRKYYGLQFVEEYSSLAEAATSLGQDSSGIALACSGALTGYAGFNWKFV